MGQHMDYKQGRVVGTGAELEFNIGFTPNKIIAAAPSSGVVGYWDSTMRDGTFVIDACQYLAAGEVLFGRHLPAIGTSSNLDVKNYLMSSRHDAAGDTNVSIAAGETTLADTTDDISAGLWGCYLLSAQSNGTITVTPTTTSGPMVHTSEAAAIADLASTPSNEVVMGYFTIQALADAIFNANTDALDSGQNLNFYEGYGIMTGGVTPKGESSGDTIRGFVFGTSALLNVAGDIITYIAYR